MHVRVRFRDCYTEKCVMNNYFGIGLDAKISLDFNNKRDEHPEKCRSGPRADRICFTFRTTTLIGPPPAFHRSRTKNMMWYGVLGTKELLHRTYKNLEQRVLLEVRAGTEPEHRAFWFQVSANTTFMCFGVCAAV